jgi:hypothetical protein
MREKKNPGNKCPGVSGKLRSFGIFTAAACLTAITFFTPACTKDDESELSDIDLLKNAGIVEITPGNLAESVVINPIVEVSFSAETTPVELSLATISLKQGSTPVPGTLSLSGTTVQFLSDNDLTPEIEYTAEVWTMRKTGNESDRESRYSWKFKTGRNKRNDPLKVVSVSPLKSSTGVAVNAQPVVTFNKELTSSLRNSTKITLKQGGSNVAGSVNYSGKTGTFVPSADLKANTLYTAYVTFGNNNSGDDDDDDNSSQNYSWSFTTAGGTGDVTSPAVTSVTPANNASSVSLTSAITVAFNEAMNASTINATTITIKQGSTSVTGTVTYSGTTAKFTPSASLVANSVYTGTVTTGAKDVAGNSLAANFTWSFATSTAADVTAPTVSSVVPANLATAIAVSSTITANFSEAMNAATITAASFTLKQGTTSVTGAVTYSGTSAKFTPASALTANTLYTASILQTARDVAGNAIAAVYTWSFTTAAGTQADVTPPTVVSMNPLNNATAVALNSKVTAAFSEAMNAATITAASFTLKQGTASVAGTVTYSGTTATFSPTSALTGSTVYTASVTVAAKDAAGNSLTSASTWSFTTTAPVAAGLSFATDVMPVLAKCNACHTHNWTTSSNASTFYTNLVNSNYVNPTTYTTSKIYSKINGGHPGSDLPAADLTKVITWMQQGSKNN